MAGYLLDTNHIGVAVRPQSAVAQRITQTKRRGLRVGTCFPVLCELEAGIQHISHREEYYRSLRVLLRQIRTWPLDRAIAQRFGEIHAELTRRGRSMSQVDMMLAAMCREMNLTLLTTDRDFEALPDVKTEDWTVSSPHEPR